MCATGEPMKCGKILRLEHMETGKNLHSHKISSPISHRNEVSGHGDDGEGDTQDNWQIDCIDEST